MNTDVHIGFSFIMSVEIDSNQILHSELIGDD